MRRFRSVVMLALGLALPAAGCGSHSDQVPAGAVSVNLGFQSGRRIPVVWARVAQPVLVRAAARLQPLQISPSSLVRSGRWSPPKCAPAHCYALQAMRPGVAVLSAPFTCSGTERACARAVAWVYVEPKACNAGATRLTPLPNATSRAAQLHAGGLAGRGAGSEPFRYVLARFEDRDLHVTPEFYEGTVAWGDGSPSDPVSATSPVGTIVATRPGAYQLSAQHFYCNAGRYTATITLLKRPAAGASTSVKLRIRVVVSRRR